MQTVREKKTFLISTLSADSSFILQNVQQEKIITQREYNNLHHSNHTSEKIVINLLDTVMNKGDALCTKFVDLLQREDIQECFPSLRELFTPPPTSHTQGIPVQTSDETDEYKMSSKPRGLCVIINNVIFDPHLKNRYGSDKDEESLTEVFKWLGFSVCAHKNQTGEQMKDLLKSYSQKQHDGDSFVCCILSHGCSDGVYGTDGTTVTKNDIFGPFNGKSCPSLVNKPKVFFIQACRGEERHPSVQIQQDSNTEGELGEEAGIEDEASLEMDFQVMTLPAEADFLVVRSTVKGYVSFRNTMTGSWFIQSLCEKLKSYCPQAVDVPNILLSVNKEISEKQCAKQMPVHKVTLRKKLIFRVPDQQ